MAGLLVATDRFECDAIISYARAGQAGGVLGISIVCCLLNVYLVLCFHFQYISAE
jgi:hypothetical protein